MTIRQFLFSLFYGLLLVACSSEPQVTIPSPTPAIATTMPLPTTAATIGTATAVPSATVVLQPTAEPTATATSTATPTSQPTPEIDQFTLARQLIEQAAPAAPDGWQVQPCEGEAAVLCISDGQENVGYAELLIFPLSGYSEDDHILRLTANELPADSSLYTSEDEQAVREALTILAEEHLAIIAEDRAITFPDDAFIPLDKEPAQMGALPALAFGFVRTNEADEIQERYLNIAAFDQQFVYWFGINFDPPNISTFVSDAAVTQFAPFLYDIAASFPIAQVPTVALSPLPPLVSYTESSGDFPTNLVWTLATELPQSLAAVTVLSRPAQVDPLTAEEAATLAQTYGFGNPLYVEARSGLSTVQAAALGMFATFDGPRTLSLAGSLYNYSDISNWRQGPDVPFAQAAPIAEQFLQANGWLTFPYALADSDQGEGVLILPIIDGVELSTPAYGVRVASNGRVSDMSIYPLDNLASVGSYPIITAETAWQQVQNDPNQPGIFYRTVLPVPETAVAPAFPTEYTNIPAAGEPGDFYTNIWAYRPLVGDGPVIIESSDFFRVTGTEAMLDELAEQTDYLVHLWGTVQEPSPGFLELELSQWEVVPDAGGVPMFFGTIQQENDQLFLVDEANRATYLLPDAPASVQVNDYAAVAGLPETVNGTSHLVWQKITIYPPPQPEGHFPATAVPMQALTIESIRLVYMTLPIIATGLGDNLFIPAWRFAGTADNQAQVTIWVTAVLPEYIISD